MSDDTSREPIDLRDEPEDVQAWDEAVNGGWPDGGMSVERGGAEHGKVAPMSDDTSREPKFYDCPQNFWCRPAKEGCGCLRDVMKLNSRRGGATDVG